MSFDKQKLNTSKPVLGKGLASLLPGASHGIQNRSENPYNSAGATGSALSPRQGVEGDGRLENKDRHLGISMCSIDEIVANDFQPRNSFDETSIQELSQSIKENGIIQPLVVRKAAKGFQLIAGERRLRAAKLAGLAQVPIVIRRTTDKEALELALIENIQREELNAIDTALAYNQLVHDFNLTQETISQRVGKDRATVANHLRLLKLPQTIQEAIKTGALTYGHGRALASLENPETIEKLSKQILEKKMSVRQLEALIQGMKNLSESRNAERAETMPSDALSLRLKNISKQLADRLSTKVSVKGNGDKGKIVIEYFTREDFEKTLELLMKTHS